MNSFLWILVGIGAVLQCGAYRLIRVKNIRYGRVYVLMLFFFLYLFAIPFLLQPLFVPKSLPGCGMAALGMVLFCWTIGLGVTSLIHFLHFFLRRYRMAQTKHHNKQSSYPDSPNEHD